MKFSGNATAKVRQPINWLLAQLRSLALHLEPIRTSCSITITALIKLLKAAIHCYFAFTHSVSVMLFIHMHNCVRH